MRLFRNTHRLLDGEWNYDDLREALRQADNGEDLAQYMGFLDRMDAVTEFVIFDRTAEVPWQALTLKG